MTSSGKRRPLESGRVTFCVLSSPHGLSGPTGPSPHSPAHMEWADTKRRACWECHTPSRLAPEGWAMHLLTSGLHLRSHGHYGHCSALASVPSPHGQDPSLLLWTQFPPRVLSRDPSRGALQLDTSHLSTAWRHTGWLPAEGAVCSLSCRLPPCLGLIPLTALQGVCYSSYSTGEDKRV